MKFKCASYGERLSNSSFISCSFISNLYFWFNIQSQRTELRGDIICVIIYFPRDRFGNADDDWFGPCTDMHLFVPRYSSCGFVYTRNDRINRPMNQNERLNLPVIFSLVFGLTLMGNAHVRRGVCMCASACICLPGEYVEIYWIFGRSTSAAIDIPVYVWIKPSVTPSTACKWRGRRRRRWWRRKRKMFWKKKRKKRNNNTENTHIFT